LEERVGLRLSVRSNGSSNASNAFQLLHHVNFTEQTYKSDNSMSLMNNKKSIHLSPVPYEYRISTNMQLANESVLFLASASAGLDCIDRGDGLEMEN